MKAFISFIIAVIAYIVLGLIIWNIVYSNTDVLSKTIVELADYKLCAYSAATFLLLCGLPHLSKLNIEDGYYFGVIIIVGVNLGIAIAANHWEGVWEIVSTILAILYNLVNIIFIVGPIHTLMKEK